MAPIITPIQHESLEDLVRDLAQAMGWGAALIDTQEISESQVELLICRDYTALSKARQGQGPVDGVVHALVDRVAGVLIFDTGNIDPDDYPQA